MQTYNPARPRPVAVEPKTRRKSLPIRINRKVPGTALKPFTDYFRGFEKVAAVRKVFGDETEEVLNGLRIGFMPNRQMYMGIRDNDGNLAVGTYHLKNSATWMLYLDIVHELFHIGQWRKDKEYFTREHMKFMGDRSLYYASPIEIPAYEHTVREAERIGMTPEEITEYLKMGDAPPKVWRSFLKAMRLKKVGSKPARRVTKFPVKIKREAPSMLCSFPDYFLGFEKVAAVRELFGDATDDVLSGVKVEFIDSPFPTIYPNEDDGHLIVANDYFRKGPVTSLYLDAFLCLNLMKALSEGGASTDPEADFADNPGVFKAYAEI